MNETHLTKKSYDEFKKKLKYMKGEKRRELSKAIGEAREHGDLKENSAYQIIFSPKTYANTESQEENCTLFRQKS